MKVGLEPSRAGLDCVLDSQPVRDPADWTALYRAVISDTPAREREGGRGGKESASEGEREIERKQTRPSLHPPSPPPKGGPHACFLRALLGSAKLGLAWLSLAPLRSLCGWTNRPGLAGWTVNARLTGRWVLLCCGNSSGLSLKFHPIPNIVHYF